MYERAAMTCFKQLLARTATLPPSPQASESEEDIDDITPVTDDAEDDSYSQLFFSSAAGGWLWKLECSIEPQFDVTDETYILLLGYLIFLLPRCGRSDVLIAACEEHRMSTNDDDWHWDGLQTPRWKGGLHSVREVIRVDKIEIGRVVATTMSSVVTGVGSSDLDFRFGKFRFELIFQVLLPHCASSARTTSVPPLEDSSVL
ncbi:hypothetical protein CPC08DRAFT_728051 [Agrocybe pediades]|nr:hypothetical protein CPC08DRAFT_728051 [Agrocybe pediades]